MNQAVLMATDNEGRFNAAEFVRLMVLRSRSGSGRSASRRTYTGSRREPRWRSRSDATGQSSSVLAAPEGGIRVYCVPRDTASVNAILARLGGTYRIEAHGTMTAIVTTTGETFPLAWGMRLDRDPGLTLAPRRSDHARRLG